MLHLGFKMYFVFLMTLFLSACSMKEYAKSESVIFTLKTAPLKFSDQAYIRHDATSLQVELFSAGVAIEKFEIENMICTNEGCMSKSSFNEKYLNSAYEADTLQHILLAQPIFEGKNRRELANGFIQTLRSRAYDIIYKVENKKIYFKDKKNHILIKIRRL